MDAHAENPKSAAGMQAAELVARGYEAGGRSAGAAPVVARLANFPELTEEAAGAGLGSLTGLMDVSVTVTAELGRIRRSIGGILKLGVGSVVDLDRAVGESVDLLVQGTLLARGEVVVVDDRFAIRIKEIVDPKFANKK